jgi:hypothetical protein
MDADGEVETPGGRIRHRKKSARLFLLVWTRGDTIPYPSQLMAFQLGVGQLGRIVWMRAGRGVCGVRLARGGVRYSYHTSHPSPIACFNSCAIGLKKVLARGQVWRPVVALRPLCYTIYTLINTTDRHGVLYAAGLCGLAQNSTSAPPRPAWRASSGY